MKTEMTTSTWEDVVFESRNKEYGAYSIRKSYDENVTKASLVALLFAAFIFGLVQIASLLHVEIKARPFTPKKNGFVDLPIILRDPVAKKQILATDHHVNKNLLERIVTEEVIQTKLVDTDVAAPVDDEKGPGTDVPDAEIGPGQGEGTISIKNEPPRVIDIAEVMPVYEGGTKAMIRFISKNIHYSGSARAIGQEGTVYVRFVVNSLGQVVDVEVIKGVSGLLDKEAVRVIAMMNKWRPGLQHNLPVNVRMVLPIKFLLE